jgi:hypothetical protein
MYDYDVLFNNAGDDQKLKYLFSLFFYLTTFFLTIIVINIVVAIIGDTYDRV